MEKKGVIPTAPAQRWREFRIRIIPRLTLAAILVGIISLWRQHIVPPGPPSPKDQAPVQVLAREVTSPNSGYITNLYVERFQEVEVDEIIARIVTFQSNSSDAQIAVLRAPISGAVSTIYRTEGERVLPGDPILQITDLSGQSETITNVAFTRLPSSGLPGSM